MDTLDIENTQLMWQLFMLPDRVIWLVANNNNRCMSTEEETNKFLDLIHLQNI